jgi:hypothetical protein
MQTNLLSLKAHQESRRLDAIVGGRVRVKKPSGGYYYRALPGKGRRESSRKKRPAGESVKSATGGDSRLPVKSAVALAAVRGAIAAAAVYGVLDKVQETYRNSGKTPLNVISQEKLDKITLDKSKPKITAGVTGNSYFVKDEEDRPYIFKQVKLPISYMQASADALSAQMGRSLGIKVNSTQMVPAALKHPLKQGPFGATLHELVPGKPVDSLESGHRFKDLDIAHRFKGLTPGHLKTLAKHEDLPKIAALDTFTGNWDRGRGNIFYDEKSDSFWGIDMGVGVDHKMSIVPNASLADKNLSNWKGIDYKQLPADRRKALVTYGRTLRKLADEYPPPKQIGLYGDYLSQEKGGLVDIVRRTVGVASIKDNYRSSRRLIEHLEKNLPEMNVPVAEKPTSPNGRNKSSRKFPQSRSRQLSRRTDKSGATPARLPRQGNARQDRSASASAIANRRDAVIGGKVKVKKAGGGYYYRALPGEAKDEKPSARTRRLKGAKSLDTSAENAHQGRRNSAATKIIAAAAIAGVAGAGLAAAARTRKRSEGNNGIVQSTPGAIVQSAPGAIVQSAPGAIVQSTPGAIASVREKEFVRSALDNSVLPVAIPALSGTGVAGMITGGIATNQNQRLLAASRATEQEERAIARIGKSAERQVDKKIAFFDRRIQKLDERSRVLSERNAGLQAKIAEARKAVDLVNKNSVQHFWQSQEEMSAEAGRQQVRVKALDQWTRESAMLERQLDAIEGVRQKTIASRDRLSGTEKKQARQAGTVAADRTRQSGTSDSPAGVPQERSRKLRQSETAEDMSIYEAVEKQFGEFRREVEEIRTSNSMSPFEKEMQTYKVFEKRFPEEAQSLKLLEVMKAAVSPTQNPRGADLTKYAGIVDFLNLNATKTYSPDSLGNYVNYMTLGSKFEPNQISSVEEYRDYLKRIQKASKQPVVRLANRMRKNYANHYIRQGDRIEVANAKAKTVMETIFADTRQHLADFEAEIERRLAAIDEGKYVYLNGNIYERSKGDSKRGKRKQRRSDAVLGVTTGGDREWLKEEGAKIVRRLVDRIVSINNTYPVLPKGEIAYPLHERSNQAEVERVLAGVSSGHFLLGIGEIRKKMNEALRQIARGESPLLNEVKIAIAYHQSKESTYYRLWAKAIRDVALERSANPKVDVLPKLKAKLDRSLAQVLDDRQFNRLLPMANKALARKITSARGFNVRADRMGKPPASRQSAPGGGGKSTALKDDPDLVAKEVVVKGKDGKTYRSVRYVNPNPEEDGGTPEKVADFVADRVKDRVKEEVLKTVREEALKKVKDEAVAAVREADRPISVGNVEVVGTEAVRKKAREALSETSQSAIERGAKVVGGGDERTEKAARQLAQALSPVVEMPDGTLRVKRKRDVFRDVLGATVERYREGLRQQDEIIIEQKKEGAQREAIVRNKLLTSMKAVYDTTKELIDEGNAREELARKAASQVGTQVPSRLELVEEGAAALGGIYGAKWGAIGGLPGALAGDIMGTRTIRRGFADAKATKAAYDKLKLEPVFQQAGRLEKLELLRQEAIAELERRDVAAAEQVKKQDIGGWVVGNASAQLAEHTIPLPTPGIGAVVAMATTNDVVSVYDRYKSGEIDATAAAKEVGKIYAELPKKAVRTARQVKAGLETTLGIQKTVTAEASRTLDVLNAQNTGKIRKIQQAS